MIKIDFENYIRNYVSLLNDTLREVDSNALFSLAMDIERCIVEERQVFIIGNGGSAANAIHIANDFLFGARNASGVGLKVHALSSNTSVLTCLANDIGYEEVFSFQLKTYASANDILIALSGSGNSKNIIRGVEEAKRKEMKTYAILGYDGGVVKKMVDNVIHINKNDMQISEDAQLILFHVIMQILMRKRENQGIYN
jgi:D-sedoheptulose 7-phosphate isomerase